MKKINSIGFATHAIAFILLFLVLIPVLTTMIFTHSSYRELLFLRKVSLVVGATALVVFSVLLVIEFKQDKYMNQYYRLNQHKKISLRNGYFECQQCGYTRVKKSDSRCPTCNINFTEGSCLDEKPTTWYLRS